MARVYEVCGNGSFGPVGSIIVDESSSAAEAVEQYVSRRGIPKSGKVVHEHDFCGPSFWILNVEREDPPVKITDMNGAEV